MSFIKGDGESGGLLTGSDVLETDSVSEVGGTGRTEADGEVAGEDGAVAE